MKLFLIHVALLASAVADDAPLEAWLQKQSTITTLDSEFIQERKLPALKNPTSTPGRLSFSKPGKVRWQLGTPFVTLAVSDGKTLTLLDAATKTARRMDADSPQAVRFSLLTGESFQSAEAFHQTFEVVESRVVSGIHQYTLKAKDRRIRKQVPWVFLDIDPKTNELRALEFELKDKSRLRTVFQMPRFNLKLDDSLFEPELSDFHLK